MTTAKVDYLSYLSKVSAQVVGRRHEIKTILATLAAGKHILLEGPPGTAKSVLLRAVARAVGVPLYFVAGSPDLTPSKLVGHFPPARVMTDTYRPEHFTEGPLMEAMRGGILFIEEFNRVPAETANVLVTAIAEGELHVPRYGKVEAHPAFRVVCSQNPFDEVGTIRISRALYDRFCCIRMGYQSLEEELEVLRRAVGEQDETLNLIAVHLVRATRGHRDIRQGASIRGAIDMVSLFHALGRFGHLSYRERLQEACLTGVSSKILLTEVSTKTPEALLLELLEKVLEDLGLSEIGEFHQEMALEEADSEEASAVQELRYSEDDDSGDERPERGVRFKKPDEERRKKARPSASELRRRVRQDPDEVSRFLNQNPAMAGEILSSPEVLEIYSYIKRRVDENLRAAAKRYASRLILKIAREIAHLGVRSGALEPVNDWRVSDEIEFDRTLEKIVERPTESLEENLVVLSRKPEERKACVVMLDHSSSMQGFKVAVAALTAATIALHFRENYGVVAFATRASVLKPLARSRAPARVAEDVLSLDARGLTNIREALLLALGEMRNYEKKIGILITDGDWTYGGDPVEVARLFDRLHVIGLGEPPSLYELEHSPYGRYYTPFRSVQVLAREGRGMYAYVKAISEVPWALRRCLTTT